MNKLLTDDDVARKIAEYKAIAEGLSNAKPLPPANPPDGSANCVQCAGSGWFQATPDARYTRCQCIAMEVVSAVGIPAEYRSVTLDSYHARPGQSSALRQAESFITGERDLYLFGGVGSGKTRLACGIANTLWRARHQVMFARVPMLLHQLQPGRDGAEELEQRIMRAVVVVFDDLGAERDQSTDYTRRTLLMLYEERGDRGLRSVFTSNKSVQELAEMQQDDRLASRIAGRCEVVRLTADDQRVLRRPQ